MQTKLDMTIIEEAKRRIGIASEANNGAAVRQVPTNDSNYPDELENSRNVDPENPYSTDVVKLGSYKTWNPLVEYERSQQSIFSLVSAENWADFYQHSKTALLFDFDYWVSTNGRHVAEFANYRIFGATVDPKSVIVELHDLWKRYKKQVKGALPDPYIPDGASDFPENLQFVNRRTPHRLEAAEGFVPNSVLGKPSSLAEKLFAERLHSLYFCLWYSVLAVNVERVSEFEHWIELMKSACCPIQIENVSLCVKLLGGHHAEDRENFLAKLRPHFMTHLQRVKNKAVTCDCGAGLEKS
jgi:hypothetical protein